MNVIFPLFENQHFIYLRLSMVITTWLYDDLRDYKNSNSFKGLKKEWWLHL